MRRLVLALALLAAVSLPGASVALADDGNSYRLDSPCRAADYASVCRP